MFQFQLGAINTNRQLYHHYSKAKFQFQLGAINTLNSQVQNHVLNLVSIPIRSD